ncbi:hypothetical protein [Dongia sp.]|uniref:hypothetical protein n=1 Tax=Dongia sp. TaxID=1977262 RepID=UPI0035AE7AA8
MANITANRRDNFKGGVTKTEVITFDVTASASDTIEVLSLPRNTVIVDIKVLVKGTASSTLSLGDAGSATRYMSAVSTASDGTFLPNVATAQTAGVISAGLGYRYTAAGKLIATIAGASVSGKTYTFVVEYMQDANT